MSIQKDGSFSPHAKEAEVGLCSIVLNYTQESMDEFVRIGFRSEDIFDPRIRMIVMKCVEITARGEACDIRVLFESLKSESIPLEFYELSDLYTNIAPPSMLKQYCKIIQEKACLRDIQVIAMDAIRAVSDGEFDSREIASGICSRAESVSKRIDPVQVLDTRGLLLDAAKRYEKGEDSSSIIRTGFSKIDNLTPIRYGDFVIIGGETKSGKTTFALNIIANYITNHEI